MNARRRSRSSNNTAARWLPVGAAGGLLVAVIVAGVIGSGDGGSDVAADGSTTTSSIDSTTTTSVPADVTTTTVVAANKVPIDRTLADGLAGDDVKLVQQRLVDLAFDPGPVDGVYGLQTKQAVWAYEKLVLGVPRTDMTGQVTPDMWDGMQNQITIAPRRALGQIDHTEIYLPQQVMVVFHADQAVLVTHVSTGELDANGEPAQYNEVVTYDTDSSGNLLAEPITKGVIGWSKTPPGIFDVDRYVAGTRDGPLGSMWNPIYINYGIAIHGSLTVPPQPASHGCIRVPMHISEYLQTLIAIDTDVYIWDGKKEPEQQSREERLPQWDITDPEWLATSSTTTTTTTTTTTLPPDTTVPTTTPVTQPTPVTSTSSTTTTPSTTTPVDAPESETTP